MRVAHRAAGIMSIVLEKEDRVVFVAAAHPRPMHHAKSNEPMHVLAGVVRHIRITFFSFDEDILIGTLKDVIFIPQQDNIAVGCNNTR